MSKINPILGVNRSKLSDEHLSMTWLSHNHIKPPKIWQFIGKQQSLSADSALALWRESITTIWQGDYHQAKALLDAVKRRLHKPIKPAADLLTQFHKQRLQQQQRSQLLSQLCVLVDPNWQLNLPRAPNIQDACRQAFGFDNQEPVLLPLHALLGYLGAEQWHQQGVAIAELDGARIHVPFGVFSPLRGEYLSLLAQAPLPSPCKSAWDIGTGSGVLAAILARRGIAHILATDTNPAAIAAAQANFTRLQLDQHITLLQQDLFPTGQADLIVCNPPWLPAKPSSLIETALYDPNSAMLKAFLASVRAHLTPTGQAWLVMSDLAEHIGLRQVDDLSNWFADAGLSIHAHHRTQPKHHKSRDPSDALYAARSQETTSLYCLCAIK